MGMTRDDLVVGQTVVVGKTARRVATILDRQSWLADGSVTKLVRDGVTVSVPGRPEPTGRRGGGGVLLRMRDGEVRISGLAHVYPVGALDSSVDQAVAELDALTHGDPEAAHAEAHRIILSLVPKVVREAFARADERVGFWYA